MKLKADPLKRNKINTPSARLTKGKKEEWKWNQNERGDITSDNT